jgi:hypothetical protein
VLYICHSCSLVNGQGIAERYDTWRVCGNRRQRLCTNFPAWVLPRGDFFRLDRLFDRTTAVGPILEPAQVEDMLIAHVLEHLACKRSTSA